MKDPLRSEARLDNRPGLNPARLTRLVTRAVRACALDLTGLVVFTEAASGAYVVTPVLAAAAGAERVIAIARTTRYGHSDDVTTVTRQLARAAGVDDRLEVVTEKSADALARADIVTNSGHVRPIDGATVAWMKPTAVVSLMYEAWEFRERDVDLEACRARGVAVAGTNEHHPVLGLYPFLGAMAIKQLMDAGIGLRGSQILFVCDNSFRPFIEHDLAVAGAEVDTVETSTRWFDRDAYDAVLVAVTPRTPSALDPAAVGAIAERFPGAVVVQFWGDLDRRLLAHHGLSFWPEEAPRPGHMAALPSSIGPEPVVLLQAGGLKVGEVLARARLAGQSVAEAVAAVVHGGYGTALEEQRRQ